MEQIKVLDDSYNANPSSMTAAASILGMHQGNRIAVLGDMAELGEHAVRYHQELADVLKAQQVQSVYLYGQYADVTAAAFGNAAKAFDSKQLLSETLIEELKKTKTKDLGSKTLVLIKGSRSMQMESIVSALEEEFC